MYTQCPECSTAFRVTADVLRQAAGKVRCGGCGNAFNALAFLSEEMPGQRRSQNVDENLPELTPEPPDTDNGLPASISAEQSAALLKTLDELAGSDIRIEDTGVEWRVLDDDELGDAADDESADDGELLADQPEIDELLEDSPTPVDQFLTSTPPEIDAPEIFEEEDSEPARASIDELRFDDDTPLPDDFDLDDDADDDTEPKPEPEEPEELEEPEEEVEEEPQVDLELSDPDEWTDILDEFEELAEAVSEPTIADELEAIAGDEAEEEVEIEVESEDDADVVADSGDQPLDMDTQFALQAEAMGIDLSGINEAPEIDEETAAPEEVDLDALLDESRVAERDIDELLEEELVDDGTVGDLDFEDFGPDEEEPDEEEHAEEEPDEEEPEETGQLELIDEDDAFDELEEFEELEEVDEDDHAVPPLTEEEQTINMQIDQDLLAIAVTDDDGFASTIVIAEESAEDKAREEKSGKDDEEEEEIDEVAEKALKDSTAGFETIIMEGEHVRSAFDSQKLEADKVAAASSLASAAAAQGASDKTPGGARKYGIAAGIAALVLLLVAQAVHQSRDTLATIPAFNNVAGPMYRALGKPLSPEWDITGWRFEVTRGSTDEGNENLTIYSRLGNKSDKPLPYPLIGISLTDRFEETIGSRVLDPADYLASDLDPRRMVQPGNTFNAVITIPSPSEEATGFKLNVCYRESGGDLRCAIDDFK